MPGALAVRFDVDSITCIEQGVPPLVRLADRFGIRFTFFVNMGYSFNWSHNARHLMGRRPRRAPDEVASEPKASLPTVRKLGWSGVLKTILLNPPLGDRYHSVFDALHAGGHELGLHGGTDHVIWQRSLDDLDRAELERLFRPAFETFTQRYGRPAGFASPGFRYNPAVLELLDREGFVYASDMSGETPFRPQREDGGCYRHFQVPVNILGARHVPLVEQGLARGTPADQIVDQIVSEVRTRDFAVLYGHPYVEGVHAHILEAVLERLIPSYDVVPMAEYLDRWRARPDG